MSTVNPSSDVDDQRHQFDTVATRDIYSGKIIAVREDDVVMPGGQVAHRQVVEHLGAVAIAALDEANRLVLIHQYRHPLGQRLWELPAGLLDETGETPLDTAQRELLEEVGLSASTWELLADVASSPGICDEVVRIFLARGLSSVDRVVPSGDEEADLVMRRVELSDAMRMVFAGEIVNSPCVAGILATHAVLTGAGLARPADTPWPTRPTRFAARRATGRSAGS